MLWDPKMHGYMHFAEFDGPMNSAMGPPKKGQTAAENHFQCYSNSYLVIFNYFVMSFLSNLQLIFNLTLKTQNSSNFLLF